jgi:hypothetical protein
VVGRRAADRLEHAHPGRVDVASRRDAHPSLDHGAQVRDDVAEHVVGDDHIEPRGVIQQVDARGVHVDVIAFDVGELRPNLVDHAPVEVAGVGQHVGLVHQRHLAPAFGAHREPERVPDDPLDAVPGVDRLLHRDLVGRALAVEASGPRVEALGVLADDDQVHVVLAV